MRVEDFVITKVDPTHQSVTLNLPGDNSFQLRLKPIKAIGADRGCVVALDEPSMTIYKSGRNIPRTEIRQVHELSAYEILRRRKLVCTQRAFEAMLANPQTYRAAEAAGEA